MATIPVQEQLLVSYRFAVTFLGLQPLDMRFQKISGLTTKVEAEILREGGENILTYHLPGKITSSNVTLTQGRMVGGINDLFVLKINEMFSVCKFSPVNIMITALDEKNLPRSVWSLRSAYPVSWSISDLDADSNNVIIDSLELVCGELKNIGSI